MMKAICRRGVALISVCIVLGSVDCKRRHCIACPKSYPTCAEKSRRCNSNCRQKKACPNKDDLCLATWRQTTSGLVMFTDCFSRPPYFNDTKYSSRCEGRLLNDTATCLCLGNGCNRRVLKASKEALKRENVGPRGINITDSVVTGGVLAARSSVNIPVIGGIGAVAVVILLYVFGHRVNQRKKEAAVPTETESAVNNQEQRLRKMILHREVGRGRFGVVWSASLQDEMVAVKLFPHSAMSAWENELNFYTNSQTEHPNVLKFMAASQGVPEGQTEHQFWLVTEYCPEGSLRGYLESHVLSWEETLLFLQGISSGVAYLHADWLPNQGKAKVPVAHRDLKSTNVLVKANGSCVLADFGSATSLSSVYREKCDIRNSQAGTYRYMSPEELDASVDLEAPEAFKQMDVYSMALVMWEVMSRCTLTGPCAEYELPYQSAVGKMEPVLGTMIEIAVKKGQRPPLISHWIINKEMKSLCGTLQECWDSDPEARLTAECVQFRITELLSEPTGMTSHSTEMTSRPTGMTSHPTGMTSHPTEMTSHPTEMTYLQIV